MKNKLEKILSIICILLIITSFILMITYFLLPNKLPILVDIYFVVVILLGICLTFLIITYLHKGKEYIKTEGKKLKIKKEK